MNDFEKYTARLQKRFRDVPNLEKEDVEEWVESAMVAHGYSKNDNIPSEYASLVFLYAEAEGATSLAMRTAHFFSFVDKDESIDKTNIAAEYRRMSTELWRRYSRRKEETRVFSGGSVVAFMRRVDRP